MSEKEERGYFDCKYCGQAVTPNQVVCDDCLEGFKEVCRLEGERRAFARIEAVMKKYECGFDYCEDSNDFWFDYLCNETVIRAASFQEALERAEALEKAEEER